MAEPTSRSFISYVGEKKAAFGIFFDVCSAKYDWSRIYVIVSFHKLFFTVAMCVKLQWSDIVFINYYALIFFLLFYFFLFL